MSAALPEGRRGQALAVGMALAASGLLWLGLVAPALDWYADRQDRLERQAAVLRRMQALAAGVPALKLEAEAIRTAPGRAEAALEGAGDAVAAATLQQTLDRLAQDAGLRIGSAETLPAEAAGAWQAITVRVTVTGAWPALVGLLRGIAAAPTAMQVDDLQLRPPPRSSRDPDWPIDAVFSVTAWRARGGDAG